MAIADLDSYRALLASPYAAVQASKNTTLAQNGRLVSLWTLGNVAVGSAPTTAVAPTSATAGAMGQPNAGGSFGLYPLSTKLSSTSEGIWLLCDRLSHQGGLDAMNVMTQTTNLPTAALTRYTSGVGVWAAFEIYTQIGATAATATISYTNQAGTSGQTSQPTVLGGTGYREVSRLIPIALAAGDYGVQAVASVNLAGSTLTTGNFGITLFRPLLALPLLAPRMVHDLDALLALGGQVPEVLDDACLFWVCLTGLQGATGTLEAVVNFSEA